VLVTIDIGANNVLPCVGLSGIDTGCINQGVGEVSHDLPYILAQLRAAAGPGVPIVAMNYYDPFLAEWLQGPAGQALAKQSVQFTTFFNSVLAQIYAAARVPVADVQAAVQTTNCAPCDGETGPPRGARRPGPGAARRAVPARRTWGPSPVPAPRRTRRSRDGRAGERGPDASPRRRGPRARATRIAREADSGPRRC